MRTSSFTICLAIRDKQPSSENFAYEVSDSARCCVSFSRFGLATVKLKSQPIYNQLSPQNEAQCPRCPLNEL